MFKRPSFSLSHNEPNVEFTFVPLILSESILKSVALTIYLNLEDLDFNFVNKDSITVLTDDESVVSVLRSWRTSVFEIG